MYSWQFSRNFPLPKNGGHFEFSNFAKNGKTQSCFYFTNETGSCETTVQLLQNVHVVDITHDNVCSSILSCFFAATINRASYF